MSDADLALFKQSVPRLINQPGGNAIIVATMKGIADYTLQQAQIAEMVANREVTPAEGRKMLRELVNPLEGFATKAVAPSTAAPAAGPGVGRQGGPVVVDGFTIEAIE